MSSTEQTSGRRTGIKVASAVAYTDHDGMEDPAQLFETAQSPGSSVEGSGKENNSTTTVTAAAKKPKQKLRFSIAEEVADELDTSVNSQHPVRKLVRQVARESIDSLDLSSVSTAAPSVHEDEENEVEASRKSTEEDDEEDVHQTQLDSQEEYPMNNDGYDNDDELNEDDDLVPPPPPESPEGDEEDDDEIVAEPADEEEASKNPHVSFSADNKPLQQDDDDDFPNQVDDYDDDDDKEGRGFEMNDEREEPTQEEDPETPESVKEQRRRKEERMKKLEKKKKDAASVKSKDSRKTKKKTKKRKSRDSDDEETESETETPAPKQKLKPKKKFNRFATTFSPKGVPLPRTFTKVPVSDYKDDSPEDKNVRRSKRARTAPLEFWRGEKPVYGANNFGDEYDGVKNMPVVVGFARADPTPYKKRKVPLPKKKPGKKSAKDDAVPEAAPAEEPFDSTRLRNKFAVNDSKVAHLWDERYQDARDIKVVSYLATMKANDLPLSKSRKKSEGKVVGKAAQSFQMTNEENPVYPGYIVGSLILPPRGIKDAESVGLCAQVFVVVKGQPSSIEIAYGDPDNESATWDTTSCSDRFLLSVGDNVLVPPGNTYRLQNHSKTTPCVLSWVIIRHNQNMMQDEE